MAMQNLQDELKKKGNRLNVRFNDEQMKSLNKICEEKKIKSRSKVLKSALELVTKGTSEIFEIPKTDYSQEERKTIQFEDDKKTISNCPHCQGKTRLDPEHYKKFQKEKLVIPSHIPGYQCKDGTCNEIHENPNYQSMPKAICNNCFQLAREVNHQCVFCKQFDTLKPISELELEKLKIIKPQR